MTSAAEARTDEVLVCPSIATISRLISGFGDRPTAHSRRAVVDPHEMAQQLKVTFRPLPNGYDNATVINFRRRLAESLVELGVTVLPWEEATSDYFFTFVMPLSGRKKNVRARLVKGDVNAAFDIERRPSLLRRGVMILAELLYLIHTRILRKKPRNFGEIARLVGWSSDHTARHISNHSKTQPVIIVPADAEMRDPGLPYSRLMELGPPLVARMFSPLVLCVSDETLRVVNLNMADSLHRAHDLRKFSLETLVPKLFLPIMPLPLSRFDVGHFDPAASRFAEPLVKLGNSLQPTGLLPDGIVYRNLMWQRSYRDIVDLLAQGRTGTSFGFVAYIEPPIYHGPRQVSQAEWDTYSPVAGFDFAQVRQNDQARFFLRLRSVSGTVYHQVPDVWVISSRSGANKTQLRVEHDLLRIGLCGDLKLQVPLGLDPRRDNVNPSYDTYVMLAIGLSAALFCPKLIANGAPLVHFHGYPSSDWLQEGDGCAGAHNPAVPCGTFESGVLNFVGVHKLATCAGPKLRTACLLEPEHGSNILASDIDTLAHRLSLGCEHDLIRMGGHYFDSLLAIESRENRKLADAVS